MEMHIKLVPEVVVTLRELLMAIQTESMRISQCHIHAPCNELHGEWTYPLELKSGLSKYLIAQMIVVEENYPTPTFKSLMPILLCLTAGILEI